MYKSKIRFITLYVITNLLMVCFPTLINAQLQTARIFTNGMVLQRDMNIPVWGTAGAADTVLVTLNAVTDTAFTDVNGKWEANLPTMSAGGPYTMTIVSKNTTLTRTNVYIGDVWLAAGQSNMAFKLNQSLGGTAEIASANNQTIRQFFVQTTLGNNPVEDVLAGSAWTAAVSANVGNFTAVGYYFARNLQREIEVPIGIINSSQGGARIETYMSKEMLGYDEQDVILANGEGERQPTVAFNTMINPLIRVPLKGIIWYQAESNGDNMNDAISYGDLFKRTIIAYRNLWGLGDIPFLWVQLPNQGTASVESAPNSWDAWPQLRANQSRALSLPNTGEATTIDVGAVDIHPTNKAPVGNRLSLVALKVAYGKDTIYSGPRYKSHTLLNDGRVKIAFDHIGGGLIAKNTIGDTLHWFSMAGNNGTLYPAIAVIDDDSVIVWSDQVPQPAIVRYAWEYNPENINFYNTEDLPAVPFLLNIVNPDFGIYSFSATGSTIERWKSVFLSWKVYGASSVTLNGEPVDSIETIRVWPMDTTKYVLTAINRFDANDSVADTITINVIEPLPTITLKSEQGDIINPETEITLTATVKTPTGGSIQKVDFFVDDDLLNTDTAAPYETLWTPPQIGNYIIKAIVTDGNDAEVESNIINLNVTNMTVVIYEAEKAVRTGGGSIKNNSSVSGGKYVDLTDAWVLTFNDVNVPESKDYQLSIRYLLNYESPKTQNLKINGTLFSSIIFTAPNITTWMTYMVNVPLVAGANSIVIQGSWNWMSFDYIALAGEGLVGIDNPQMTENMGLLGNTPNPFKQATNIIYSVPKSGFVTLQIYDITGNCVATLLNEYKSAGTYNCTFFAENLTEGIYLSKLTSNNKVTISRMLIMK